MKHLSKLIIFALIMTALPSFAAEMESREYKLEFKGAPSGEQIETSPNFDSGGLFNTSLAAQFESEGYIIGPNENQQTRSPLTLTVSRSYLELTKEKDRFLKGTIDFSINGPQNHYNALLIGKKTPLATPDGQSVIRDEFCAPCTPAAADSWAPGQNGLGFTTSGQGTIGFVSKNMFKPLTTLSEGQPLVPFLRAVSSRGTLTFVSFLTPSQFDQTYTTTIEIIAIADE